MNRRRTTLGTRLLISYIAVCAVGIGVLFVTARLTAPSFFDQRVNHMAGMDGTGHTMRSMLGASQAAEIDDAMTRSLNESLFLAAAVALVVGAAASLLLSRQLSSRARRLAEASAKIAEGDYGQRVPADGPAELASMAESFNAMAASLEGVERRRRELIGDVAHELRSPVSTLRGYVEALSDGVFVPGPEVWEKLTEETARMARLVDELGELSRAEAGQLALEIVSVRPCDAVAAAAARLSERFAARDITLVIDVTEAIPPVLADPGRLAQVLTNLLTNALTYTEPGGSVMVRGETDAAMVAISVTDTGVGIPAEHLPHVFERFYRVDRSRARASGGSGVGLTIARALAEAMGGSLSAYSAGAGRGSTFTLRLPIVGSGAERSSLSKP